MNQEHLSPERWQALLAGTLEPSERAALGRHLSEPCEVCESILAEAAVEGELDSLDAEADDLLLGVRGRDWPVDELAGRRWEKAVRAPRTLPWAAGAIAAAALLLVVVGLPGPEGDGTRLKGGSGGTEAALPRLEVALVSGDGQITPVLGGSTLPRFGHLLVRFDSPETLCGALEVRSGGQVLLREERLCLAAGASTYSEEGEVVAIALNDPALGEGLEVLFVDDAGSTVQAAVGLSKVE